MHILLNLQTALHRLIISVGLLLALCGHWAQANRGYLVVTPSVFRPGSEEVITVTILQPTEPINVEAKLFCKAGHLVTQSGHEIFGKGTIKLQIPKDINGICSLKLCGNCASTKDGSFTFYNSTSIVVEKKGASVFIQTDRPIYKPGQKVHINLITTGGDLLPVNEKLTAYIVDPRGTKMMEWRELQPFCCGLTNISYALTTQPLLGKWAVFVELQGHLYNRSFEIQKYVLPKFEVSIQPPAFIEDWDRCQTVYIRSRYTYGRDVTGFLTVSMQVHGTGYYKNYASNKTAKAIQMAGVAGFNVCVAEMMSSEHVSSHFRGALHIQAMVQTEDGETVKATDNSCPVNRHLIDIQFTSDTRKHYKPGLPFSGKLVTYHPDGTPAPNITVQVKAQLSNKRTEFETLEFISASDGLIYFELPALPRTSQTIWIEAKVLRIADEDASDSYLPVYLAIGSWYSPSDCHMMVDGPPRFLSVGDTASFRVHSSCTCNFTLYHEVMARGNLVHSGIHFARHVHKRAVKFAEQHDLIKFEDDSIVAESYELLGVGTCTINVKFQVTHRMAPFGRLLVYYVRPNGEGVADSLKFNVKPAFTNRISIELSEREIHPGDDVMMHINTRPDSCVCIGAVDKSVHLLRPGYQLSKDEIFDELESYDISIPEKESNKRRRRNWIRNKRSFYRRGKTHAKDAHYAFEESGLLVMTDSVQLNFKHRVSNGPPFPIQAQSSSQRELIAQQKHSRRRRSFFPETWIWSCFNTSSTRKENGLRVQVPDSITSWVVEGLSISSSHGLALAEPVQLKTFKHFFVQFRTPYSVIRGEQIMIPLTIHNYLHNCAKIHLRLKLPDGVQYVPAREEKDDLHRMCIGMEETKTVSQLLVFETLGWQNISAEAEAFADSKCCSGIISNDTPKAKHKIGEDSIDQQVLTEPEGVERGYSHTSFFCPNERLQVFTPNKHEFQYLKKPDSLPDILHFSVRAGNNVHIALSLLPHDNQDMYEVVLGGWSNTMSWIAMGKDGSHLQNTSMEGILSRRQYRDFWISWHNGHIKVGSGSSNETMLDVITNRPVPVKFIGFSTGWGANGEFRIWSKMEETGKGFEDIFNLNLPSNIIPNSHHATVSIIGDVMGPALFHLDGLLDLPAGCGEQNMIRFAPHVYILQYLEHTQTLQDDVRESSVEALIQGYQRQLTYRRNDGSYSAFGDQDASGNLWLTAFVLRCFAQANKYVFIDDKEMSQSMQWINLQQRTDGSYPALGRLINKEIQGGIQGKISLTAYVVIGLLDAANIKKHPFKSNIKLAQRYLEMHAASLSDPYTAAMVAYALTRLNSRRAYIAVQTVHEMAIVRDDKVYWKHFGSTDSDDILLFLQDPSQIKVTAADIEIASYVLLTSVHRGEIGQALPIVKWLSMQRNNKGGFLSTQDTCIGLQALSAYAMASYSGGPLDLSISLAALELDEKVHITSANAHVRQSLQLQALPTGLFVSATGDGCALFQVDVRYNIPDPSTEPAFEILVRIGRQKTNHEDRTEGRSQERIPQIPDSLQDHDFKVTLEACTKWLHPGSSNMAVLEMSLLSGFRPDFESLDQLLQHRHLKLKRYDFDGRKVMFYFDEIRSGCLTCVSFGAIREFVVGKTQPASIRIYDYYEPLYETSQFYNASHIGELIQDLCEDEECNEIREDVELPEFEEDCNSILGCYGDQEGIEFCTCYQDCDDEGPRVCSSDGEMYKNACHMEVAACQNDVYLEVMHEAYCFPEPPEDFSGDFSGDDYQDLLASGEGVQFLTTESYIYNDDNLPTLGFLDYDAFSTSIPEDEVVTNLPTEWNTGQNNVTLEMVQELEEEEEEEVVEERKISDMVDDNGSIEDRTEILSHDHNMKSHELEEMTTATANELVVTAATAFARDDVNHTSLVNSNNTSLETDSSKSNGHQSEVLQRNNSTPGKTDYELEKFLESELNSSKAVNITKFEEFLSNLGVWHDILGSHRNRSASDDRQIVDGSLVQSKEDATNFDNATIETVSKITQTQNKVSKTLIENNTEQKVLAATTQVPSDNDSNSKLSQNEELHRKEDHTKNSHSDTDTGQKQREELTTALLHNKIPEDSEETERT